MKHLTIDEMIAFVSISELNTASLELASKVNTHIIECDLCRNKVRAFQEVFCGLGNEGKLGGESGINAVEELIREVHSRSEVSNNRQRSERAEVLER